MIKFSLNDRPVELGDVAPTLTLLRYLRDRAGLSGTKEGCAEGDCGACTVAVLENDRSGERRYRSVNSCLLLLPMVQNKHVYTVEGLKQAGAPHLVQQQLTENLGSQCGYCTPGVVMALFEACYRRDLDEPWKLDAQMCGNLCRCTGYRPIRDTAKAISGVHPNDHFAAVRARVTPGSMALDYQRSGQRFVTPGSLPELFKVLEQNPTARLVHGGTDLALDITKRFLEPPFLISLEALPELRELSEGPGCYRIGGGVTLADLEDFSAGRLPPLERMLRYFGARQIKNRGTVGGNLCTASPIGDLAPVFLALDAEAILLSKSGERRVALRDFFTAYRTTALRPGEILGRLEVSPPNADTRVAAYKVSKRRELDISTVSACFAVEVDATSQVTAVRLAFGGMADRPRRALRVEQQLLGQDWTEASVEAALPALDSELTPLSDHRGSSTYRRLVAKNLLRGFFHETQSARMPGLSHPHTSTVGGL